jgi:hypothetical protein
MTFLGTAVVNPRSDMIAALLSVGPWVWLSRGEDGRVRQRLAGDPVCPLVARSRRLTE